MAKSDRHKKLRRKEKAKTQLTGVKKLARPQNIIEPTFKARKIIIREQLQGPGEGDVVQVSRNKSLQEVLYSLNHHNVNAKKDGINGLKEIINAHPESLYSNLDKILEKIGALTSDIDSSIRRENVQLAELVFVKVTEDQIQPFWTLLLTHVKCALSNLNPAVRQSCLPFISILLALFPNLVSHSLEILLPSLLGLISSIGKTSNSEGQNSKSQPQLKLEISNKDEASKQRVKVLHLLAKCLDLKTSKHRENGAEDENIPSLAFTDENPVTHVGLYYPFGYEGLRGDPYYYGAHVSSKTGTIVGISGTVSSSLSTEVSTGLVGSISDDVGDIEFWPHFVESCFPILHQTWLEVRPSLKDGTGDKDHTSRGLRNLQSSAVEILECIVSVMSHLIIAGNEPGIDSWSSSPQFDLDVNSNILRRLRKDQGQDLKKYFLRWLPFSALQESQRKTLTEVNLKLFQIAAKLRLIDGKNMEQLNGYLQVLMKHSALDSMQITSVLEILALIRISPADELSNEVLLYSVSSGYFESVSTFLLRILQLGQGKDSSRRGVILESINWELVVSTILNRIPSFTPVLLNLLTLISLRKLIDLVPLLRKYGNRFREYLSNGNNSREQWEDVIRILHYADFMDLVVDSNYFDISVPAPIEAMMKSLETISRLNHSFES